MSAKPPTIDYDRDTKPFLTRRSYRLIVLLTFLNTILITGFLVGPPARRFAQERWASLQASMARRESRRQALQKQQKRVDAQEKCKAYSLPEDTVIYEERPAEAARLMADGRPYRATFPEGQIAPPNWQTPVIAVPPDILAEVFPGGAYRGILFMHERAVPSGQRRLVVVRIDASQRFHKVGGSGRENYATYHMTKDRVLTATAFEPLTATTQPPVWRNFVLALILPDTDVPKFAFVVDSVPPRIELKSESHLCLFAGQADAADPSHFTIAYELDGAPGTIDGWLKDDAIFLRPQQGRPEPSSTIPRWNLLPQSTTAPAN